MHGSLLIKNSNNPNWHFPLQATVPTSCPIIITHCLVAIELKKKKVKEAPADYPESNIFMRRTYTDNRMLSSKTISKTCDDHSFHALHLNIQYLMHVN